MRIKLIPLLLSIVLVFTGCTNISMGAWRPAKVSHEIKPYVERSIEILDDYLAFNISADEVDAAFDELCSRLEPLGVIGSDSDFDLVDVVAAGNIILYGYENTAEISDAELRQMREILSFQLDNKTSKHSCSVISRDALFESDPYFDELEIPEILRKYSAPVSKSDYTEFENFINYDVCFDAVNGLAPTDIQPYVEELVNIVGKAYETQQDKQPSVYVRYNYFDQTVFALHLTVSHDTVSGRINLLVPEKKDRVTTIESVEDIGNAIILGQKHLGNYKIPK